MVSEAMIFYWERHATIVLKEAPGMMSSTGGRETI
jgi:hypothetical protein